MLFKIPLLIFKFCAGTLFLFLICSSQTVPPTNFTTQESATDIDMVTRGRIPLYIGAFFPFGGGWDGSGVIPVVEMALDHINAREDVLPGYELKMVWNDTQCEAGLGTRVLFDQIFSEPHKLMLLGGGCSTATQAIAATAYHWNLNTMSYAASSSALSNREVYPYFYRTYMPDAMYNPARVRLMKDYKWKRVATIHENHELFSLAIDDLLNILSESNITVISSESFAENPTNQVKSLQKQDARIIVSNMYETKARRVFCEAYKDGITGNGYVWMLLGWYSDKWWEKEDENIECSTAEMREAVKGYISVESLQLGPPDVVTVANITSADYVTQLEDRLTWRRYSQYEWNPLAPYGYDATWAIALMLNHSITVLETKRFSDNTTRRLEDFNYDDDEMARMFFDDLKETFFIGVTGPVSFKNGDREGITQIEQLRVVCDDNWYLYEEDCYGFFETPVMWSEAEASCQSMDARLASINNDIDKFIRIQEIHKNQQFSKAWLSKSENTCGDSMDPEYCSAISFMPNGGCEQISCTSRISYICTRKGDLREEQIGLYNALNDELTWFSQPLWPDDQIPLDRTPEIEINYIPVNKGVPAGVFSAMSAFACIGIMLALFFLVFNMIFRNKRSVKLSSPYLNNLIIIGSLVIYIWVVLYGLGSNLVELNTLQTICQIRHWLLSIGFVLGFGAMFSKTWRVYRVATFKQPKRVIVSDIHLFMIVLGLLCFDVVLLSTWQIVDPMSVTMMKLPVQDDPNVANQKFEPYYDFCNCDFYGYWLAAVAGYKGLLLIFGTFLAWETRKVTIKELNDSKLIGICVYNVVILCAVGVAVSATIRSGQSHSYIFLSCIVIFCTSITLIVVFVPKIVAVIKYPDGRRMQTNISIRPSTGATSTQAQHDNSRISSISIRASSGETSTQDQHDHSNSSEKIAKLEKELLECKQNSKCIECGNNILPSHDNHGNQAENRV